MIKLIKEFEKDLTNEELGQLIKMSCAVLRGEEVEETENRIINYLFKTQFKPAAEKYNTICQQKQKYGKMGGRPKKEANSDGR